MKRIFCLAFGAVSLCTGVQAEPIRHPTAIFAGLDKITGRIINFDVAINETVQFGALQVTPRVCNTRPQTEAPQTTSFVEVDEFGPKASESKASAAKQDTKRIFSGWMFAASPGLHGVEHPVYDVWLVDCKGGKETVANVAPSTPVAAAPAAEEGKKGRSRRVEPAAPAPVENQSIGPSDQAEQPGGAALVEVPTAAEPAAEDAPREPRRKRKSRRSRDQAAPDQPPPGDAIQPF